MTLRRLLTAVAAAVIALLLALQLRNRGTPEKPSREAAGDLGPRATTTPAASGAEAPSKEGPSSTEAKPAAALHGLRLLEPDVASKRGWAPKERPQIPADAIVEGVLSKWRSTMIDVNCTDQPLAEFLDGLRKTYGLETKIDPELDAEDSVVTFKVSELAADQAIDLVLKMADLAFAVDAAGTFWVTTKDRVGALATPLHPGPSRAVLYTAAGIRSQARPEKMETSAEKRAAWMKGRTVSVTIANKPLVEAVSELAEAGGLKVWDWTEPAKAAAEKSPIVSVVGENLPLDKAIDDLLGPAGLDLDFWYDGTCQIETKAEADNFREFEKQAVQAEAETRKKIAALRDRRVKIEGKVLSLADVGAQLAAQLGLGVRIVGDLEFCAAAWESDGMEQAAGEVLDILAKDAPLTWGLSPEVDPESMAENPEEIWLVPPR